MLIYLALHAMFQHKVGVLELVTLHVNMHYSRVYILTCTKSVIGSRFNNHIGLALIVFIVVTL